MIQALFHIIKQIITIFRITYTYSFYKNITKNAKYWILMVSKGYISVEKTETNGSITIQTIFFLFGDINVNIRSNIIASNNAALVTSHIKEMQKFKEQVLFFVPVLISLILHAVGIVFSVLQLLKQFDVIN